MHKTRNKPQPKIPSGTASSLTVTKLKTILGVLLATLTIALYSPVIGTRLCEMENEDAG